MSNEALEAKIVAFTGTPSENDSMAGPWSKVAVNRALELIFPGAKAGVKGRDGKRGVKGIEFM